MGKTVLCLLIVLSATALVCEDAVLVRNIESAIRVAEPDWKCVHGVWNGPPPDVPSEKRLVLSIWLHTAKDGTHEKVVLDISQVDSRESAKLSLRAVREAKVAPGWTVQPYRIGEEGYLCTAETGSRYEIHFRKNTTIVRVKSDSLELTQRFAGHAEGEIPSE